MEPIGKDILNQIKKQAMQEYYESKRIGKEIDHLNSSIQTHDLSKHCRSIPRLSQKEYDCKKTHLSSAIHNFDFTVPPPGFFSIPPPKTYNVPPAGIFTVPVPECFTVPPPMISNSKINFVGKPSYFVHDISNNCKRRIDKSEPLPPGTEDKDQNITVFEKSSRRAKSKRKLKHSGNVFGLPPSAYRYNRIIEAKDFRETLKNSTVTKLDEGTSQSNTNFKAKLKLKSRVALFEEDSRETLNSDKLEQRNIESLIKSNDTNCQNDVDDDVVIISEENAEEKSKRVEMVIGMCKVPGFLDICDSHHKLGNKVRLCSSYGSSCKFFSSRANCNIPESANLGRNFGMCEIDGFHDLCLNHHDEGIKAVQCSAIEPAKCSMSRSSSSTHCRWDLNH